MENLVSIVIPVYNTPGHLLDKCINSVMQQTYKQVEAIIVDDGSTSGIEIKCDEYAAKYNNVLVIHKTNGGLSAARNSGQRVAKGNWLIFLDSDDWLEENTCEILVNKVDTNTDVLVWGFVHEFPERSEACSFKYKNGKIFTKNDRKELILEALSFPTNFSSSCWKMYSLDFLKKNCLEHNEYIRQGSEDLEFSIRVLNNVEKLITVNERLYHYIMTECSITNSFNEKNAYSVLNCLEAIKNYLIESKRKDVLPAFYMRAWYAICASIISGFMNPNNGLNYGERVEKLEQFLAHAFVVESMNAVEKNSINLTRRIALFLCRHRLYFVLQIMAAIRNKQKGR